MDLSKSKLAEELVNEITDSKMTFTKKMTVLKLLDKAFRKHLGVIYFSNDEFEDNDILRRSL